MNEEELTIDDEDEGERKWKVNHHSLPEWQIRKSYHYRSIHFIESSTVVVR